LPGTVSELLAGIDAAQLARFGLRLPRSGAKALRYGGPSCELLTRDDSGYLLELGQALGELLGQAKSPIRLRAVPRKQLLELKRRRDFCFLLDVARSTGATPEERYASLLYEADARLVNNAPPLRDADWLTRATATLPLGVVGELEVQIATLPGFNQLAQFRLGEVWKT
jgi:uncharacterized protein YceH (UPF0502 family)